MDVKKVIIYWLPVLIWASVIFYSSSQPYQEQDIRPTLSHFVNLDFVGTWFKDTVFHYAGQEVSVQKLGAAGFLEFFIRKGAHLFVYFILGFLVVRATLQHVKSQKTGIVLAITLTVLYALSDEFHQGFTTNRSPHIEDVGIDTIGGLLGITLYSLLNRLRQIRMR
jgi:VanZ family protein